MTEGSWTIVAPPWKLRPARSANPTNALPFSPIPAKRTPETIWPYTRDGAPSTTALLTQTSRAMRVQVPPKSTDGLVSNAVRSEEHTSELQSHSDLVCRLLLEKK